MVAGFNEYNADYSIGSSTKYNLTANSVKTDINGGMFLGDTKNGILTGEANFNYGYGTNNDRRNRSVGAGIKADYTHYFGEVTDVSFGAGVEAGYGWSFNGGNEAGIYTWPTVGSVNIDGETYPTLNYRPWPYVNKRVAKTDRKGDFYVSPTATAEVGFTDNYGARTSIYGTVGTDLVSKDKFAKVGAKWETPLGGVIEDYVDASFSVGADYTFNNQNRTTDAINKKGWSAGVGFKVFF